MDKKDWEQLIAGLMRQGVLSSPKVIRAMRASSREIFLPQDMKSYYASDSPLPIGFGQTISAPHSSSLTLN